MNQAEIISIVESMGFHLDNDQWEDKGWMRFQLKDELDEKELRLIWYKEDTIETNLRRASQILFKAGQKAKINQLSQYMDLDWE